MLRGIRIIRDFLSDTSNMEINEQPNLSNPLDSTKEIDSMFVMTKTQEQEVAYVMHLSQTPSPQGLLEKNNECPYKDFSSSYQTNHQLAYSDSEAIYNNSH